MINTGTFRFKRPYNASFFASHLSFPRQQMVDFGNEVLTHVYSGGKALYNMEKEPGSESKDVVFGKSKFAICPENMASPGYATEKIYHAFMFGAIPIYWPEKSPEPRIFNPKRIIHYDPNNPSIAGNQVKQLMENKEAAIEFFRQPIIVDGAKEYASEICDNFAREVVSRLEGLFSPPPTLDEGRPFPCNNVIKSSQAQEGQDIFLFQHAFRGICGGTFVEVGGADGFSNSNTYAAEMEMGWKGLLIEASPSAYRLLHRRRERRNSLKVFGAIGDTEKNVTYMDIRGPQAQLSCVREFASEAHLKRIEVEMKRTNSTDLLRLIPVPTKPLSTWLALNNLFHVNWLALDVEGAELVVLATLDFKQITVDFIQVEKNTHGTSLIDLLHPHGFKQYEAWPKNKLDMIFCHESVC